MTIPSLANTLANLLPPSTSDSAAAGQGRLSWLDSAGPDPLVIGHRGMKIDGVDENSIQSLIEGTRQGADAVELDIQFLNDGTPILAHDNEGYGDMSPAEFFGARAGRYDGAGYPYPPTLEEWVAVIEHGVSGQSELDQQLAEMNVFVEFKADSMRGRSLESETGEHDTEVDSHDRANLARTLDLLHGAGIGNDQIVAASFSVGILNELTSIDPDLSVGLFADRIASGDTRVPIEEQLARLDATPDFVSLNSEHLRPDTFWSSILDDLPTGTSRQERNQAVIDALKAQGIEVVFAATSERNFATASEHLDDLSGIITDRPGETIRNLDEVPD